MCVCALSNAMSYAVKSYMYSRFFSMVFDKLTGVGKNSPNCRFDTLPVVKFDKLKGSPFVPLLPSPASIVPNRPSLVMCIAIHLSLSLLRSPKPGESDLPWTGMVFGLAINSIWYWCSDQVSLIVSD